MNAFVLALTGALSIAGSFASGNLPEEDKEVSFSPREETVPRESVGPLAGLLAELREMDDRVCNILQPLRDGVLHIFQSVYSRLSMYAIALRNAQELMMQHAFLWISFFDFATTLDDHEHRIHIFKQWTPTELLSTMQIGSHRGAASVALPASWQFSLASVAAEKPRPWTRFGAVIAGSLRRLLDTIDTLVTVVESLDIPDAQSPVKKPLRSLIAAADELAKKAQPGRVWPIIFVALRKLQEELVGVENSAFVWIQGSCDESFPPELPTEDARARAIARLLLTILCSTAKNIFDQVKTLLPMLLQVQITSPEHQLLRRMRKWKLRGKMSEEDYFHLASPLFKACVQQAVAQKTMDEQLIEKRFPSAIHGVPPPFMEMLMNE